jgi:hypothetical protein
MALQSPAERPFSVVENLLVVSAWASAEAMGCVLTAAVWRLWRIGVEDVKTRRVETVSACENFMFVVL